MGKTTLVYHLGHVLARLGHRTLAVDLDPQANLTSMFLDEDRLEEIWFDGQESLLKSIQPRINGTGDIDPSCLAMLRNYPIGSHAALVSTCYKDFDALARRVAEACGLEA